MDFLNMITDSQNNKQRECGQVLPQEFSFNEDIKSKKRKYGEDEPEDDEVVWIPKPKIKLERSLESNQSDEKEVVFIGETNNPLSTMPHPRHACTDYPFSPFNKNNHKTCSNCYCFVCDMPASLCEKWEVHQNSCDDKFWNRVKKERNLLLSFDLINPNPNYPGVAFSSIKKKWRASYFFDKSRNGYVPGDGYEYNNHLGFFKTESEALNKSLNFSFNQNDKYHLVGNNKDDLGASWDEDRKKWKATNYSQKQLSDLPECWYDTRSEAINKSLTESFNKKNGLNWSSPRNYWKPIQCPIIGCTKEYSHRRTCANHPKILCCNPDVVLGRKRFCCPILSCNYGDNSQKRCVFHPKFLCYDPKDYIG